jgi:nicotinamidase-related amidase
MLLIVDAQVNQFEPPMAVHDGAAILARLKSLVARARAANVPVAFIQNDGGEIDPDFPGTPGWALHPELLPNGSERVYRKTTTDSFHETGLLEDLRAAGVIDLIIAGMQSNYCIDATTRRAVKEGFKVTLVSNAHSTFSFTEEPASAIIQAQNKALGALVALATTAEISFR